MEKKDKKTEKKDEKDILLADAIKEIEKQCVK